MSLAFSLVRPLLQALDAEQAHQLTITALKHGPRLGAGSITTPHLRRNVFGIDFPNPVGLAAGFDKNGEVPDAMLAQGFGFVEVGTVTPLAQPGNARPRLFRLTKDQAVINRMGFNNDGHGAVREYLLARREKGGVIGVNIGANKDSPDRTGDYAKGIAAFEDIASYITINISSPNTPGLRDLQGHVELLRLLEGCNAARRSKTPLLLKISPDLSDEGLVDVARACGGGGVDGVIISNTTVSRHGLQSPHLNESGGLSGAPLFDLSTKCLAAFHGLTGGKIPLIGVGGISDAGSALAKLQAGASLVQLYSALVYQGPSLVADICHGLDLALERSDFSWKNQNRPKS